MRQPADALEKRLELEQYLAELDARPWAWGECDCTRMIMNWIERLHGADPAQGLRYRSADEACELARAHGGFTALVIRTLDAFGLPRAIDPEPGDVAIVDAPRLTLKTIAGVMALRHGALWIVKTPGGMIGQKFPIIAAWRV